MLSFAIVRLGRHGFHYLLPGIIAVFLREISSMMEIDSYCWSSYFVSAVFRCNILV